MAAVQQLDVRSRFFSSRLHFRTPFPKSGNIGFAGMGKVEVESGIEDMIVEMRCNHDFHDPANDLQTA